MAVSVDLVYAGVLHSKTPRPKAYGFWPQNPAYGSSLFLGGNMDNYLEMLPLSGMARYSGTPPKNALPFTGYPRQHPSEKNKLLLVYDPLGPAPTVMEFLLEDILFVEDIPSVVTEDGEGIPLVKLWIRRGAHGVILEPFEVSSPIQFANKSREIRERFLNASE